MFRGKQINLQDGFLPLLWIFIILKCGSASLLPDIDGPLSFLKSIDSSVNVSV